VPCLEREGVDTISPTPERQHGSFHQALTKSKRSAPSCRPRARRGVRGGRYAPRHRKVGVCMGQRSGATNLILDRRRLQDSIPMVAIRARCHRR